MRYCALAGKIRSNVLEHSCNELSLYVDQNITSFHYNCKLTRQHQSSEDSSCYEFDDPEEEFKHAEDAHAGEESQRPTCMEIMTEVEWLFIN